MLYCPICKAQYRAGFNHCSGCLAELVATREQADATRIIILWEGTNLSKFDAIVTILRDRDIPNRTRAGAGAKTDYSPLQNTISQIIQFKKQMTWQVVVLEADYLRARSAAQSYLA